MPPIRSLYADDPDMAEIVFEFAADAPERATLLERLLAAGQLPELRTLAHQLKGAGGGYGFPQVTEAAALLESAVLQGGQPSALKQYCDELCGVLRSLEGSA
jgi:HPt (histidine-containing phosphotransfer) domain-containing protein